MIRYVLFAMLALLIAVVTIDTSLVGQDKIERRDRKSDKAVIISGKIKEESSAGFKITVGGAKDEVVPAADVLRVFYDDIPVTMKQAYYNLFLDEDNKQKDPAKLLKDYQDFYAKVTASPDVKAPIKRYLDYRITMLKVAGAETEEAKGEARRALEVFATTHKASWETPFVNRALAKMQLDRQDYENAIKTLNDLVNNAAVPDDVKQESELMLIDVMFQANKTDAVKAKLDKAMNDPKTTEAQKSRFRIYQVGLEAQAPNVKLDDVVKKLDDAIAKSTEPSIKALAYNLMGDCYMQKQLPRDAMWSYLWVDVVYSQDKAEHLKAMTKLLNYFESEKDNEKVQMYKEKIARLK